VLAVAVLTGHPTFVAQNPELYHPPTVMTYMTWPDAKSPDSLLPIMATTAIRRASQNFGLNLGQALAVMLFVGQAPGRFPVVLTIYTQHGKMGSLVEHRRRSWTRIRYL
jgi:hypothetical protein